MAHSAECRLSMEANRPGRNLRFVVGHLMHYEALRLRIVEIEYDISKNERAKNVSFQGTGHVNSNHSLQQKPSTGQLGRKSPPPQRVNYDPEDDDELSDSDPWSGGEDADGEAGDDLGLQRFPSGSARPPQPPPDLMPDVDDDDDDDEEPASPEEVDQATLEELIKNSDGSTELAKMYNGIRGCPCHKHPDAPKFERMWELPGESGKEGTKRAVAQVWASA